MFDWDPETHASLISECNWPLKTGANSTRLTDRVLLVVYPWRVAVDEIYLAINAVLAPSYSR